MQLNIFLKANQKMGRRSKQTVLQRRHIDGSKYTKRYTTALIIREMQIKITMRYHLTPVRTAIIKKIYKQMLEKRKPSYTVGGNLSW